MPLLLLFCLYGVKFRHNHGAIIQVMEKKGSVFVNSDVRVIWGNAGTVGSCSRSPEPLPCWILVCEFVQLVSFVELYVRICSMI